MKRSELTQDDLNAILAIYAQTKSYAAVGRLLDMTPAMVTKIIEENSDKVKDAFFSELSYRGPIPEEPKMKEDINIYWRKELEKLYLHVVKTNGELYCL